MITKGGKLHEGVSTVQDNKNKEEGEASTEEHSMREEDIGRKKQIYTPMDCLTKINI